ncbi:MAG: UDP-N-acetylmuramoyl-tripeptide--D-alanyl-D-alanine ligase [Bacteroidales bacterium]|nr:UDP-N-acetylmuramoyl-tripeptide--D-alanyl-D-alanine ligase [Bacteroidales bacterium]
MNIKELYNLFEQSDGISTDTRSLKKNMIFCAIKGENFDGNNFVKSALEAGAKAVITSNKSFENNPKCYFTNDTIKSLQELAHIHRQNRKCVFIAITGTNGKTTTKEIIRETLSTVGKVQATQGNLNNHIGVPLTLLSIEADTEFAIIEMGANHIGEIETLCDIAYPDYGLITNIGDAHLLGFGSIEGVIKTKTELYKFIKANGKGIFVNEDDPLLVSLSETQNRIFYSSEKFLVEIINNDEPQLKYNWSCNGKNFIAKTNLIGQYNLPNMLAATAIALHFGGNPEKINEKISNYIPNNMRSQWIDTSRNHLILDAYNANPSSMALAIKNIISLKANKKMLIIGDMLELGEYSKQKHFEIINLINSYNFDKVIFVGNEFEKFKSDFPAYNFYKNTEEAMASISKTNYNDFTILIKGSRSIGLEKLKNIL